MFQKRYKCVFTKYYTTFIGLNFYYKWGSSTSLSRKRVFSALRKQTTKVLRLVATACSTSTSSESSTRHKRRPPTPYMSRTFGCDLDTTSSWPNATANDRGHRPSAASSLSSSSSSSSSAAAAAAAVDYSTKCLKTRKRSDLGSCIRI